MAVAEVLRLYGNADAILTRLSEIVGDSEAPVTWPHHFDLASLVTIERDPSGNALRTIGIGLAPPDSVSTEGYWYVSPWSKHKLPAAADANWDKLPIGTWHGRNNGMPMAMLPVGLTSSTEDPAEQHQRTASFLASAFQSCTRALGHG